MFNTYVVGGVCILELDSSQKNLDSSKNTTCTMKNIIEIREIRDSSYQISDYVHTFLQKVRKRIQHLDFHQRCVRTLAPTDFLNSFPIICKSLRKLSKFGKVFIAVQLQTFCTSIQDLVVFSVNSNFFVNICSFV